MRIPLTLLLLAVQPGCHAPLTPAMNPPPTVLHPAEMVGFLVTCDAARCREFFVDRLGFDLDGEDDMALVFVGDGRMLRVQKMKSHEPRPYTVLGWNVADIDSAVARLERAGVRFEHFGFPGQDASGIMTFTDGARIAWFKDPDGNVLSLAQLP